MRSDDSSLLEKHFSQILSKLSHKRVEIIEIYGKCDKDGVLKVPFIEPLEFSTDNDYLVKLVSAELASFFPNIIEGKNDKLYYNYSNKEYIISFQTGSYDIQNINIHIQDVLKSNGHSSAIEIILDNATGKCKIFLKEGYSIDFTKENTIRNMLGFEPLLIANKGLSHNISKDMINVVLTNKIFIKCNVIEGAIYQGLHSDVLYSFGNSYTYGYPISIINPVKRYAKLIVKIFSEMRISFRDENNLPINFLESPIGLTIEIKEC